MPATGDKAKAGQYVCEHCKKTINHEKDGVLPYCPHCEIWTLYRPANEGEGKNS